MVFDTGIVKQLQFLYNSFPNGLPYLQYLWNPTIWRSRVNSFLTSQEIPHLSHNPKVHYHIHNSPLLVSVISQTNLVHIRPCDFKNIKQECHHLIMTFMLGEHCVNIWFKLQKHYQLPRQRISMVYLSHLKLMLGDYLKIGNDHLIPTPYLYTIQYFPILFDIS